MFRTSTRTSGDRIGNGISRAVIDKVNDSPFLQSMGIKIRGGESSSDVEHAHPFGFTAFPMGKTTDKQAKGGMMKGAPEVFLMSLMGNNSHPVGMPAVDRRFRPNNMKEGETVFHDAAKQFLHFGQKGSALESPMQFILRVAKDKEQKQGSGQSSGGGGSGQGGQKRKNNGADVAGEKEEQVNVTANKDGTFKVTAQDAATITAKTVTFKCGGCTLTISKDGFAFKGGKVTHEGKNIGSDHKHGEVQSGGGQTGNPV